MHDHWALSERDRSHQLGRPGLARPPGLHRAAPDAPGQRQLLRARMGGINLCANRIGVQSAAGLDHDMDGGQVAGERQLVPLDPGVLFPGQLVLGRHNKLSALNLKRDAVLA